MLSKKGIFMIKSVDHILIHTATPEKTLDEIETAFGIKAYIPLTQYSYFRSAMLCFGNVDIEVIEIGEKKDFEPYLYGVAFEPSKSSWETIGALQTQTIAHTLPLTMHATYGGDKFSWTIISLDSLLDNVPKVPYGTSWMFGDNFYAHMMSALFSNMMKSDVISKASTKDTGAASIFFCKYTNLPSGREESRETFIKDSGKYGLKGIESIMIEKEKSNTSWERLGSPKDDSSVQLAFKESNKNRLHSIVLQAEKNYDNKEIMIGDVRFVIR